MALRAEHDLHKRRLSRNIGVGIASFALVAIVFMLTIAKVSTSNFEAYDHVVRPSITIPEEERVE